MRKGPRKGPASRVTELRKSATAGMVGQASDAINSACVIGKVKNGAIGCHLGHGELGDGCGKGHGKPG